MSPDPDDGWSYWLMVVAWLWALIAWLLCEVW